MIRINLLPVRVSRRQEAVKKDLIIGGLGLAVVLLICAVLYILLAAQVNEVAAENSRLQKDLENLKAIVARVDEIEKINQELERKLAVIDDLSRNKVGPVHLLDELSTATPEKLYLKSLREKAKKITIQGYAASPEVISQFLTNLEKSEWFDDVFLMNIEEQAIGTFKLKFFEITARMVVVDEKAKKAEGDKAEDDLTGDAEKPRTPPAPAAAAPPPAGEAKPPAPPPPANTRPEPKRGANIGE